MAKKRKGSRAENGISAGAEIAPEALANLVDKLKHDLAIPEQNDLKPSKSRKKKDKKDDNARGSAQQPDGGTNKVNPKSGIKAVASEGETNRRPKKKKKSNSTGISIGDVNSTRNGFPASYAKTQDSHRPKKPNRARQLEEARVSNSKPGSKQPQNRATNSSRSIDEASTGETLLGDILALGGTEADLELIRDIDSEEEIVGESHGLNGQKKTKSDDDDVCTDIFAAHSARYVEIYKSI